MPTHPFTLRNATLSDVQVITDVIAISVRGLSQTDYTPQQMEAAIGTAFGVDSELIRDGTYFVAEAEGVIVGCGGWSRRKTLFGGDSQGGRESILLDPAIDAARIRAFFVRPDWARRGVARALLELCEKQARASGFHSTQLMATLPGHRMYKAEGYVRDERITHQLPADVAIEFIPMHKTLG